ncbi:hypothetical protein BDN71DRAFT_419279 [Pleurotus eryngii]|uniref:Uncharacterized protein n=1 Tax=Pleurotus eryngii TaxID=5323 RepID=A0A9P6A1P6_PLEER|nr:hypothetical protein BDN71DRAFT_419279 [Pleurotus eryngii]
MPISSMMCTFYEDGLIYYAALLGMCYPCVNEIRSGGNLIHTFSHIFVNMIVSLTRPTEYINLFLPTQVALHSALSSRLFLNLRQSLDGEVGGTRRIDIRTFEGGTSRTLTTSALRFAVGADGNDEDNTRIIRGLCPTNAAQARTI